ncbi:hypothetical protein P5G61_05850 [Paenibacillus sp. F6_3S_P_1C]|uniref:Uncharacterized protein n=1 Tax=Paenibacillus vandeheii TaxID=3035917 RepID=A0ABT8J6Q4_9BACL|nr:hypothetical protein [Paenibacillus vandeheii]MDN4600741.1 hypothetical protein [Paenibacillus vandeheii]
MKKKEIAQWLYDKILEEQVVFQYDAVREVEKKFGEKYIYVNDNGNKAIDKKITSAFRDINKDNLIEWDRYDFKWVLRLSDEEAEDLLNRL